MKKLLTLPAIALLCLATTTGCKKNNSNSNAATTYSMTATAGGTAFSTSDCLESSNFTSYFFTGQATGGRSITIGIASNNLTTGSYTLDSITTGHFAEYFISSGNYKMSKSGTVTITSIVAGVSIAGTFNFTCTDGTTVTGGKFTAKIP